MFSTDLSSKFCVEYKQLNIIVYKTALHLLGSMLGLVLLKVVKLLTAFKSHSLKIQIHKKHDSNSQI